MGEVVGVAVVHGGRVLAARRSRPAAMAGRWELPGGKVERGEVPEATAVREVREELGCTIEVTGWLPGESVIATGSAGEELVLRIATARLSAGDPVPTEHDAVWWLRPEQLAAVTWAEADVPFVGPVRDLLGSA